VLDLERLLSLWTEPLPDEARAIEAFREFYADPVLVNGSPITAAGLVARARAQQVAFSDVRLQLLERVESADKLVIVFVQRARHTGPLQTPLGEVAPTGHWMERQIIDVLTVRQGVVTEVRVVGDELGSLVRLGALKLATDAGS